MKKINNILKKIFIIITSLILMYVTLGKYIIVSAESDEAEVENYNLSQDTVPDGYVGIYTAEDFQQLKNSNGSSKYILMKDIDFENEKFEETLKMNIKEQLKITNIPLELVNTLKITPIKAKKVIIKFYEKQIECSTGIFELEGNIELLNYLYKAGMGSKHSAGFGMFQIV